MCGGMPGAWLCSNLLISINGLALALPVACLLSVLSCFSDHVVLACLLIFLAVMVTSGLFVASVESLALLDLAAAAKTSAMLLLKVNGMAEEPEASEFLKSWLLLDFETDEDEVVVAVALAWLATSDVLPSVGPLLDDFCLTVGSLRSCIKFFSFSSLAINPMYCKSLLTRILVGIGGGEAASGWLLGIDTLGILKIVSFCLLLELDGTGELSLSAEAACLVVGGSMGAGRCKRLGAGGIAKSGLVHALKSACDLLCLTSYSSILF